MNRFLLLFFVALFPFLTFSQDYIISGNVEDANNLPIAYANVVLINTEYSSPHIGTTTNEKGEFSIENVSQGNYTLKISFLGFNDFSKDFEVKSNQDLGKIILEESLEVLDDVTIVAKRPTVTRMVDRLVFNVENSTLSNNNALDILKHTPGVIVSDGSISVKQSTPTIYINDRRVHLSINEIQQLLEGTSANNIKSIEVITNPPAKYEAEGGAVLNIVTSKNLAIGYHGSIFGNYKQGSEFPKYSFGTSHFFKSKKLNTYINYSINPRKDFRNNDEYVNFINDNGNNVTSWETDFERIHKKANQNINANIDYDLNSKNTLSFSTNMLIGPRENSKTYVNSNTEVFNANQVLDSSFYTTNKKVDETFNLAFTLDYVHKFKKEGEKLSINAHYTNYDFSNFQNVDTDYWFPDQTLIRNNRFQTFSSQEIKLYTGQLDYELPINESSFFETGFKLSNINSENILDQFTFINGIKEQDLQNSDVFDYDETNYAAYSSFSKDWSNWSLKLGVRAELTDTKGISSSTSSKASNTYLKFFPSFYILHSFNDKNDVYFNYNRRIYRPRYSQLNPFKYYLNDNAYITGDPNLKPQIDDVFTLGYTINQKYTLEAYYRYESKPTLEILFQNNDENLLIYKDTNINRSISYGLDFTTYTKIVDNWNLYVLSSCFYYDNKFIALESGGKFYNNTKWTVYSQIVNYFSFLKDKSLTADLSFLYISPITDGPSVYSKRFSLDFNLRKTLWNNRASLSLGVVDMFNTLNFSQTTKYLNQDVFIDSRLENRLFTAGFIYKFGNFNLQSNSKTIENRERERLD